MGAHCIRFEPLHCTLDVVPMCRSCPPCDRDSVGTSSHDPLPSILCRIGHCDSRQCKTVICGQPYCVHEVHVAHEPVVKPASPLPRRGRRRSPRAKNKKTTKLSDPHASAHDHLDSDNEQADLVVSLCDEDLSELHDFHSFLAERYGRPGDAFDDLIGFATVLDYTRFESRLCELNYTGSIGIIFEDLCPDDTSISRTYFEHLLGSLGSWNQTAAATNNISTEHLSMLSVAVDSIEDIQNASEQNLSDIQCYCSTSQAQNHQTRELVAPHPCCCSGTYGALEVVGRGSFGTVYRALRYLDQCEVALKVMRFTGEDLFCIAKGEYELLNSINHPKIIQALDFFPFAMGAVLVLDFFNGRTIDSVVGRGLDEEVTCILFSQLLSAVEYLHNLDIIHRDINAGNVLVSGDFADLRLIDFGVAKYMNDAEVETKVGAADYLSPEVLQGESPSKATDIWAAGLCLHLMLLGRLPKQKRRKCDLGSPRTSPSHVRTFEALEFVGAKWERFSEPCLAVLRQCLEIEGSKRSHAATLLASKWMRDFGVSAHEDMSSVGYGNGL